MIFKQLWLFIVLAILLMITYTFIAQFLCSPENGWTYGFAIVAMTYAVMSVYNKYTRELI